MYERKMSLQNEFRKLDTPEWGKGFEQIACNVCNLPHRTEECPLICTGVQVQDTELPSKAILTLPDTLMYKKLTDNTYEIISKFGFSKGTQFGPLVAPKTTLFNPKCTYVLKLFSGREYFCYLDISDESNCNWMCLVPFSADLTIKNCICYQLRDKIYFSVVNDIFPSQSLIVSYSPGYAAQIESSNKINDDKQPLQPGVNKSNSKLIEATKALENNLLLASENQNDPLASISTGSLNLEKELIKSEGTCKYSTYCSELLNEVIENPGDDSVNLGETNGKSDNFFSGVPSQKLSKVDEPKRIRYIDKLNKRLGAVLAVEFWKCKFCREEIATIADFAAHLVMHYKSVGAARTEKFRLEQKLRTEVVEIKEETVDHGLTENANEMDNFKNCHRPSFPYNCDICVSHKTFNRAEYIIRHLRKHTGEYCCNLCDQVFSSKDLLKNHLCSVSADDKTTNVSCTLCDKVFSSHRSVEKHLKLKHGKIFKCTKCQRIFSKAAGLRKHICRQKLTVQADPDISILLNCEICNSKFIKPKDLSKHLQTHKGLFVCNYCGKSLSNDSYKIHNLICETLCSSLQSDSILKCPQPKCTSVCKDVDTFRNHLAGHTHPYMCPRCNLRLKLNSDIKHHECTPFCCDTIDCDSTSDTLNDLKKHIYDNHQEITSYCYECAFPFATISGYESHKDYCEESLTNKLSSKRADEPNKQRKSTTGSYVCETCGATYTKWNSLKSHRYTHGPKRFVCELCGKGFHRRELMEDHKFVHQVAQFQCNLCGKKMKSKKSLDVHLRIHSGIKRFRCEDCGKSFAQKVNLITHQYIHLKDQGFEGFPCPYCDKRFSSKEYLSFHIEGHEKGKTHHCEICGRSFVKPHMLRQHKKLTHSDCRYSCEFCDVIVRLHYSLIRHLKNRHPECQEIWDRPGYSTERMIEKNIDYTNSGVQSSFRTAKTESTKIDETLTEINEIEADTSSPNCEISVEEHIVEFSKEGATIPQSNMVFLRMDQEGEIVLAAVTDEGQTMVEVEAEVLDDD